MGSQTAGLVPLARLGLLAAVEVGERGEGGARGVALPPADLLALVEHGRLLALADEAHQPVLRHLPALLGQTVPVLPEGGIPLAPAIERRQRDAGLLGRQLHFPAGAEVAQEEHPEPGRRAAAKIGAGTEALGRDGWRSRCDDGSRGDDGSRRRAARRFGDRGSRRGGLPEGLLPGGCLLVLVEFEPLFLPLLRPLPVRPDLGNLSLEVRRGQVMVGRRHAFDAVETHHVENSYGFIVVGPPQHGALLFIHSPSWYQNISGTSRTGRCAHCISLKFDAPYHKRLAA